MYLRTDIPTQLRYFAGTGITKWDSCICAWHWCWKITFQSDSRLCHHSHILREDTSELFFPGYKSNILPDLHVCTIIIFYVGNDTVHSNY